jgi:Predicted methyltransferase regulatory domain
VPTDLQPLLAQTEDPELRETIRDFAANKRFRRDLFMRGNVALTASEHRRALSGLSFALAVPRSRVVFEFAGPLIVLAGREDLFLPIVNSTGTGNGFYCGK